MRRVVLLASLLLLAPLVTSAKPGDKTGPKISAEQTARQSLNAFNRKEESACRSMNQEASATLWADDGTDLIPGMQPMVGKATISKWLNGLTPQLHGAKIEYCTIDWRDIKIEGDWAYEWGITRQKIDFPPPQKSFENRGKMVLILKRQQDGSWKIELESWNSTPEAGE